MSRRELLSALAPLAALAAACTRHQSQPPAPLLEKEPVIDVAVLVFDMSGSFQERMEKKGHAFMTAVLNAFKRELAGEDGTKVILAQISGEPQGPIFDGSLRALNRRLGNQAAFHAFVRDRAKLGGSRVFDSVAQSVDYAAQFVGDGTRAGVFVASDMDDNLSGPGGEERLVRSLSAFARKGGSAGFYFVDLDKTARWAANCERAGFKPGNFVVEADIASPRVPNFGR